MPLNLLGELRELRTQEATGMGTDVRLVLLEAVNVRHQVDVLDRYVIDLAGGPEGLLRAMQENDPVLRVLAVKWEHVDLETQSLRLREIDDVIRLLGPEGA